MFPTGSLHSNLFPCKCLYIFNVKINTKCQNLGGMQFRTSIQKTQTSPKAHTVYIHTHSQLSQALLSFHSNQKQSQWVTLETPQCPESANVLHKTRPNSCHSHPNPLQETSPSHSRKLKFFRLGVIPYVFTRPLIDDFSLKCFTNKSIRILIKLN